MGLLLWDLRCRLMSCKTSHMFKSLYLPPPPPPPPPFISPLSIRRWRGERQSIYQAASPARCGSTFAADMIINIKALAPDVRTRCLSSRNIWSPDKLLHSPPLAAPPLPPSRESPARCVLLRVCSQVVAARRPYDDN